jgi:hypothetical protein
VRFSCRIELLVFSFLLTAFCGIVSAQSSFIKLSGRNSQDVYTDMDETTDGGIIFGGYFFSDYTFTRCNASVDTLWNSVIFTSTDYNMNGMCALADGRFAIAGTDFNQGYEIGILAVTDSSGMLTDTLFFPSYAWGIWGNEVFALPDSGVMLAAYEDGYTCDNTVNIYRYDQALDAGWSRDFGTCDSYVNYSEGFGRVSGLMHFLRVYEYYFNPVNNSFYAAPTIYSFDTSNTVVFDSTYNTPYLFNDISGADDGGVIVYGTIDTLASKHIVLMRLSPAGDIRWARIAGSLYDEYPVSVVETNDHGFAVLASQYLPGSFTGVDLAFYKFDSLGQLQHSAIYGSTGNESGITMIKKTDGSLLILGRTNGFGPQVNMVIQLDSSGDFHPAYMINSISNHYCSGDTAVLSVSPPALHYLWSTGDTTASIQVTTGGNIELTVTDSTGSYYTVPFFSVYFDAAPDATINDTVFSICDGQTAQLAVPSGTGNQYEWYFNGAVIDSAHYRTYNAVLAGDYVVVVSNACGKDSSLTASVSVHQNPVIPQVTTYPSSQVCNNTPVTLTAFPGQDTIHWEWFANNNVVGDTLVLTQAQRYFITVTVTNQFGCVSPPLSLQVIIDAPPDVDITDSLRNICIPGSTVLPYTYSANYGTFTFMLGNTITSTRTSPWNLIAYTGGLYKVILSNTCGSDTDSVIVIANLKPVVDIFPDTPRVCSGNSILVTSLTHGLYQWTNNLGVVVSTDSVLHISGNNVSSYYYLKVTDPAANCFSTYSFTVSSKADPAPVINPNSDTVLCPGEQVVLEAGNFNSYLWSTGDNVSSITVYHHGTADTSLITITVVDSLNCSSSDTIQIISDLCTSVPETGFGNELKVFPNPSSGRITFEINETIAANHPVLFLFDFTGRVVLSERFIGNTITLEGSGFSSSQYCYLLTWKDSYRKGIVHFIR